MNTPGPFLTFGVEEEFLLVDQHSSQVIPVVDAVVAAVPPRLREQVQREFMTSQVEIATAPQTDLGELRKSLLQLRGEVARAAGRAGARLVPAGTCPVRCPPPPVVDTPRFQRMVHEFGAPLSSVPGLCACHVHVGLADRDLGVRVLSYLRRWLPVLHAATANSPFYGGRDTGFASWRSVMWSRWPTAGPPPHLGSAADYDQVVDALTGSGAMLDDGMLYWYARLNNHVPTVEVRVGDVCPTVDDTVLIAALVRALVATAITEIEAGVVVPVLPHWLVSAAHWRAGRDGLEGGLLCLSSGAVRPAGELLADLVDHVSAALAQHGDLATVTDLVDRLGAHGTGAARQRRIFADRGDLGAVTSYLAAGLCRDSG